MKKLLSLVLALVMLLPVFAAAESDVGLIGGADGPTELLVVKEDQLRTRFQNALDAGRRVNQTITLTELSGAQTGDAVTDAAIADLVKALGISVSAQGDEASFALTLSGKDVITLGGAISGDDLYLSSNMLGGTVVVGTDEFEPLFNRLLDLLTGLGLIDEVQVSMLRDAVASFQESFAAHQQEEAYEDQLLADLNLAALQTLVSGVVGKVTRVENIVVPRMCDPAVSGLQLVVSKDHIQLGMKLIGIFLLDNPKLLDVLANAMGLPTEAQLKDEWAQNGQLYTTFGFYKDEAEFLASQETIEAYVRENIMKDPALARMFDGDVTFTVYLDEQDQPVYFTASLPVHKDADATGEAGESAGTTVQVDMTYTRQTVAQGVAHVGNIFVDDASVTIDALVGDSSIFVTVTAVEPEVEPMKLLELSVTEAANAASPALTDIDVVATAYDGENAVLNVVYDGEYECSDAREYAKGKLTLTAYTYQWPVETSVIELVDAETGTVEYVDTTVTISGDDIQPEVRESIIAFDFSTDTAISGVDYTTHASFTVEAGGVRFGMKMTEETADPQPSIMTGNVVRPVELNEADFSNWFSGVMNAFELWMAEAIQALPESVLMMILYAGMM